MDMPAAIRSVVEHRDLTGEEMADVMRTMMSGKATPAQMGGFLVGLRMKGETVDEIAAAAKVMRELASGVAVSGEHVVDTCGTGGDGASTFNISTASAFVTAAAGGTVAMLVAGLRLDSDALRRGAMATILIITAKLFLIDLAEVEPLVRVLTFMGFGALLLALSYYFPSLWRRSSDS